MATKKPAPKKAAPAKKAVAKPAPAKAATKPAPKKAAAPAKPAPKKAPAKPAPKKAVPAKTASKPVKAAPKKAPAKPAAKKTVPAKPAPKPVKKAPAPAPAKPAPKKAVPVPAKKAAPVKTPPAPVKAAPVKPVAAPPPPPPVKKTPPPPPAKPVKKQPEPIKEVKVPKTSVKTSVPYRPGYTPLEKRVETTKSNEPLVKYSDADLNEFRELINKKLEAAKKELAYLQGLITRKDEMGGDNDDARYMTMEDGSMSMEREQLSQMASRQITYIDHLEKAIMRIENKTYGICRVTGKLIDKARLRAVPHATLSLEAKLGLVKPSPEQ
ncbi:TraR/DksA family transcriptional regulator [Sediminibacterium ginsengisoli]|uniref:RNA polymerase-binding transcription factor DksA n=1 Tax=Sediminibacterium ginsengisoli TaxID=413434 RepID=A0A1T4K5I0_9BACT|nr:TraR/DksA C4-type zinc finger protein [Sediminibacterium ginsengisoli]SJZ37718.1 RNA polymerase-binding transcription factor DksA [Sediminibacterium ginsengisoli]